MATIREYFDTDLNRSMSTHTDWTLKSTDDVALPPLRARIFEDYDANAKYWSFLIPPDVDAMVYVRAILSTPETSRCVLSDGGASIEVKSGLSGYSEFASSTDLMFTRRIFFYIDAMLTREDRQRVVAQGKKLGFYVLVRDREYAAQRSAHEKPLAFISHDSRDKESLVRELALEMSKLMCPVWYDEYSLKVGDNLRASIEKGLKETPKCVVILSPNFFSNEG